MVAIPNQEFQIRNPGLAQTPEAIETFLYLGTASAGEANVVKSLNSLSAAADEFGQGPLPEDLCRHLGLAGGPALAMRIIPDITATIGSVTKHPVGSSTGTIAVTVTPQAISRAWQIDDPAGTPVYTEYTTEANDATASDVILYPATEVAGDQFAVGFTSPFAALNVAISTLGTVGTTTWKYWNGTAWTALTGVAGAGKDFTAAGAVTWTMPTDWARRSINGSAPLYYVVAEVATLYTVNPAADTITITDYGPFDSYDANVEIETTGTLGAGEFSYLLDGSDVAANRSPKITIPSGGVYDIPNTGLRVTFTAGAGPTYFEDGDEFTFTTEEPRFSTTALAQAFTTLTAGIDEFAAVVLCGTFNTASDAAAMYAAFDVRLETFATAHRYCGGIQDAGTESATTTKTEFAAVTTDRVMSCFSWSRQPSLKPFTGWASPSRSTAHTVAARAGGSLISTHLGRWADGPLEGVTEIGYNEEKDSDAMSAAGFCTLRSWQGFPGGFYVNRPNIKTAPGSDYDLWPYRRIADVACSTAHRALQRFMNTKVRILRDGTGRIDPKEALRIEGEINAALATNLTEPLDAEGNRGHLAAVAYIVDLEHNVATTNQVSGSVAMVRDGYAEKILTTLGFAASVA